MDKAIKNLVLLMGGIMLTGVALSYMQTGALGSPVQRFAKRVADGYADFSGQG